MVIACSHGGHLIIDDKQTMSYLLFGYHITDSGDVAPGLWSLLALFLTWSVYSKASKQEVLTSFSALSLRMEDGVLSWVAIMLVQKVSWLVWHQGCPVVEFEQTCM